MTSTDNSAAHASQNDESSTIKIVYILYLIGFFTGITTLIGVVIAYMGKSSTSPVAASHYKHQINIFWRGVILWVVMTVLYVITTIIGAATMGFGFILMLLPLGLMLYWAVWTIIQIVKGFQTINRNAAI